jgi:hypothetical protein
VNNGVDTRARLPAGVGIGDVQTNDLVACARRFDKRVGAQIGQPEAVALAMRLPEGGADATGGAGEQNEAALGLTHAHHGAWVVPYRSITHFA